MQGSVNSLSAWSVFKRPHRTTTVIFVLSWISSFLENTTCRLEMLHPPTASADNAGRKGAAAPWSSESAVGWGWGEMMGPWGNAWESFKPSHWQSRRTGGSGVSAHCRMTPYCHLRTEGKQHINIHHNVFLSTHRDFTMLLSDHLRCWK